jgi:hypothetical protein
LLICAALESRCRESGEAKTGCCMALDGVI